MVISNCKITQQDSEILRECVMSKDSIHYNPNTGYYPGVELSGSVVYSVYDGVATVRRVDAHSVVIIQSKDFCIAYGNLVHVYVQSGQQVAGGTAVGDTAGSVYVEYYTSSASNWTVRLGQRTWYKSDPSVILYNAMSTANDTAFSSLGILEMSGYPSGSPNIIEKISDYTLSNNKGV